MSLCAAVAPIAVLTFLGAADVLASRASAQR
jgi:hypothetical protein